MGQYLLSFYFKWSLTIGIAYDRDAIEVRIPFITILIGLQKGAHGIRFFKD